MDGYKEYKEIVGIEVTDERVGDSRMFGSLIDQSKQNLRGRKIVQADADGAYDTKVAFNKLQRTRSCLLSK